MLLGLLTAILLWVGMFFGGTGGLIVAAIIVGGMNFAMYFWSDKIVLWMYKAKEVQEKDHPELYSVVRETAKIAGLPMPKVYIVPSDQPNAFATGRNPKHAAVAATTGILKALKREELKGVMAHEMSHVKNRDTLIQTISGTIAGVIGFVGSMARWSAIFGGSDDDGGIIGLLVLGILTPIMAVIIQLAISRSREYLADETAARMLHSGLDLAAALQKLEDSAKKVPMRLGGPATENLFIVSPFKGGGIMSWLSTHPPMEKRIKRLRSMQF
jgi:heat shock protein HtpX